MYFLYWYRWYSPPWYSVTTSHFSPVAAVASFSIVLRAARRAAAAVSAGASGGTAAVTRRGHVLDGPQHVQLQVRAPQFGVPGGGVEPVPEQVAVPGAEFLDAVRPDVVVGDDQPVGGHEPAGRAGEPDARPHQFAAELGRQVEPVLGLELRRRQGGRQVHALVGHRGRGGQGEPSERSSQAAGRGMGGFVQKVRSVGAECRIGIGPGRRRFVFCYCARLSPSLPPSPLAQSSPAAVECRDETHRRGPRADRPGRTDPHVLGGRRVGQRVDAPARKPPHQAVVRLRAEPGQARGGPAAQRPLPVPPGRPGRGHLQPRPHRPLRQPADARAQRVQGADLLHPADARSCSG